ncbi:hypothetical protein DYB32_006851 [Aphanomyces invadans]|uniref:Protein phosphatase 1 regulatory subunit 7 n=1 Tax=Aphanomyces invadans TaxID=157072 RepID=A0A418AQH1_9STRA|nr:hypothetical protein DYB32_006851 [Aphanomyces invadans]
MEHGTHRTIVMDHAHSTLSPPPSPAAAPLQQQRAVVVKDDRQRAECCHEGEHNHAEEENEPKELQLTDCIDFGPDCEEIRVRSNLLYKMTGIENLENLTHLELYDNQIKKVAGLDRLVKLRYPFRPVLPSRNSSLIRTIPDLSHLTQLQELYVANNKLTHITGIASLSTLKKLDLGANRIRVLEGLDNLIELEQLWLGKNKITKIQSKLVILDVGANRIPHIPDMASLQALEDLWLNDNNVASFDDLLHLTSNTSLQTLYLERNPLASDFEYRKRIHAALPFVSQIDATPIA